MRQRDLSLDIIRIFACLMVVTTHAPMPATEAHSVLLAGISLFTLPCNALFFMVSGALLLPTPKTDRKLAPPYEFLKKRLGKVLIPTLLWSLFYIVVRAINYNLTIVEIVRSVLSLPFSPQGHGVLWFMYALVGLYLLSPILSAWLKTASEKEELLYLSLWAITLLYPILHKVVIVNTSISGILYNFSGYAGFFLLGHYLQHYGKRIRMWHSVALYALAIVLPLAIRLAHIDVDISMFMGDSIFGAIHAVFWWKMLKAFTYYCGKIQSWKSLLAHVSSLTFGIYLMHIFIMRNVLWNVQAIASMPQVGQIVVTIVLTFGLSLLFSWLISLTSLGHTLIGYRKAKSLNCNLK